MTASDERAIGRLEAKVDILLAEQTRAAESRKQTYEKLEELNGKITATEVSVDSIDKRLSVVEVTAAEISKWRERGIGAWIFIVGVSSIAGGFIVAYGKKIWGAIAGG